MKFIEFTPHLGLVFTGLAYTYNEFGILYLLIGWLLLNLSDSFDNRKIPAALTYGSAVLLSLLLLTYFQWFILNFILLLIILYPVAKRYPISAFYKGFAYSLLFFLPFRSFNPASLSLYAFLGILATISEISHEAHHSEKDAREGYCTTARFLNLKFGLMQRMLVKAITGMIGIIVIMLVIL